MTYRCLLQMVLLLCLSTTALCRSYSLLRFQQGLSLEVCQNFLWQLPSTPQHYLEARMDFQVPEEMKQAQQFQKEDAVLVMYEMLQQIFSILNRDFSSTGWSDAIIEHLLQELYGQMNRLEPIQKEIMQKQTSTMGDTTVLHLRKYYFNLRQYLKSKEHNRCAGAVVQMQLLRNFSFLKSLTGYLRD
ncbi:interferon beta-2-like [Capricornis sumatraensis]|uniref:interferon beta-2-like n=1 Tax=Capricornis sumatraensis TaxID=34865 RepID=UPI0036049B78